jgi:hypothetical protein
MRARLSNKSGLDPSIFVQTPPRKVAMLQDVLERHTINPRGLKTFGARLRTIVAKADAIERVLIPDMRSLESCFDEIRPGWLMLILIASIAAVGGESGHRF